MEVEIGDTVQLVATVTEIDSEDDTFRIKWDGGSTAYNSVWIHNDTQFTILERPLRINDRVTDELRSYTATVLYTYNREGVNVALLKSDAAMPFLVETETLKRV